MAPKVKKQHSNRKYNEEDFKLAYHAIIEGKLSLCKASKKYNIPKTTLHERISNCQLEKPQRGTCTMLTKEEEERLANWVLQCWQCGFQNLREHIISYEAKTLLAKSGRKDLRNGTFSRRWYVGFCRRHPEVRRAVLQQIHPNASQGNFSYKQLESWFERLKGYFLNNFQSLDINSQNIFYCMQHSAETMSMLLAISAEGTCTFPLLVFPSNGRDLDLNLPPKWYLRTQWKTCLIDQQVLYYYLTEVLHSYLKKQNIKFPVIICLDHQQQPLPLFFMEECFKMGLIIVNLYYNAFAQLREHALEPLNNLIKENLNSSQNNYSQYIFNLQHIMTHTLSKDRIRQEFLKAGLYPFNFQSVNPKQYLKSNYQLDSICSPHNHDTDLHFSLNYEQFKLIVGPAMLIDLEEYQMLREQDHQQQHYTPEFLCLSKIYQKFKGASSIMIHTDENSNEQTDLENLLKN